MGRDVQHGVPSIQVSTHIFHVQDQTTSNTPSSYTPPTLRKEEELKYLGVTIESKLHCHRHISNITARGNSTLGFIRCTVTATSENIQALAYKEFARLILEYTVGAWDSMTKAEETQLKAVQR